MSTAPSRRAVLGGTMAVLITACTRRRAPATPAPVDPDLVLRSAAVSREQSLLDLYDAAATTPVLQARLAPLRAEHVTHLQALGGGLTVAGTPPALSPTVAQLANAERRAAAAHGEAAVGASRRLAPVLASLAASEATHAVAL